jgi:chromosome segregation ATPase
MFNTLRFLLLISLAGFLAGCSVFGVATKSELRQQNTDLTRALSDQERSLDDRVSGVSEQQRTLDDRVSRAALQLENLEEELGAALVELDSRSETTAAEVADMRIRFEMMQGQVQLALADLENVAETATRAETGSRQAVQLHQDAVLAERQRLRDRLRDLDARISSWYPQVVPEEQLRRQLQPEAEIQSAAAPADREVLPRPGLQIPDAARRGVER